MNVNNEYKPFFIYEEITIPVDIEIVQKNYEAQENPGEKEINIPFGWTE